MAPLSLHVGEKHFKVAEDDIKESGYFQSLLVSNFGDPYQEAGSIFVNRDGDLFVHILRFLRNLVLPLFYDHSSGIHDLVLYEQLLAEAQFFQIDKLEEYLKDKQYFEVVQSKVTVQELRPDMLGVLQKSSTDTSVQYVPQWVVEQVYLCPRRILVHRGNESACGRACKNEQGDSPNEYEQEAVLKMTTVVRRTVINRDKLIAPD